MNPVEELTSVSQILHLTHHRNRNQHRLSKWYSSFSQLRRQVRKLITELETLNTALSFSSESSKYVTAARGKAEARVEFMRVHLLPRCYVAFGNLVADNQYAVLGIMLVGILARVRSVLLLISNKEEAEEPVTTEEVLSTGQNVISETKYDLGEVIERDEGEDLTQQHAEVEGENEVKLKIPLTKRKLLHTTARKESSAESPSTKLQKKKKKRKKGDAFDDLFDSLI